MMLKRARVKSASPVATTDLSAARPCNRCGVRLGPSLYDLRVRRRGRWRGTAEGGQGKNMGRKDRVRRDSARKRKNQHERYKENHGDVPRVPITGFHALDAVRKVSEAEYQVGGTLERCGCGGLCEDGKDGPKRRIREPQQMVQRAGKCGGYVGRLTRNEIEPTVQEFMQGQVEYNVPGPLEI
ncbi:hypothetical protein C8J57DRAFT_1477405, partial [Mycena rebaudengoi]